jgi:hypothetical protein
MPKRRRTPQEKKRLSLTRDRRNDYGENSKSSRKNITRRKAIKRRAVRRVLKAALPGDEALRVRAEIQARRAALEWRKDPDRPLAEVIARRQGNRGKKKVAWPPVVLGALRR